MIWPVVPGAYTVGDPMAPVAVCTLADDALHPLVATSPGVAIAGRLNTANLGIEDLIVNVTANPNISSCWCAGRSRRCSGRARRFGCLSRTEQRPTAA